jgi:hypothetical protein
MQRVNHGGRDHGITISRLVLAMSAMAAVAACQTIGERERPTAHSTADGELVFSTQVVDKDGYCMVSFTVTYPEDVTPHSRQIRTELVRHGFARDAQDYALPIPPLAPPDSFVNNGDGTITFNELRLSSIGDCLPELAGRTLAIGPCASGPCLPARFVPGPEAERLGLRNVPY